MKGASVALVRCTSCYALLVDVIGEAGKITQACPRCVTLRLLDVVRQLHVMEST